MPSHNYTPRQALELLFEKMENSFPMLYQRMKDAVDAGKDVQEQETSSRRRVRSYRKNLPYTDEEALAVALTVLESHLVETRKLAIAADIEFSKVLIAPPKHLESKGEDNEDVTKNRVRGKNEPKVVEIEVEPETVLEKENRPNVSLKVATGQDLDGLESLFGNLRELISFTENRHGNTH